MATALPSEFRGLWVESVGTPLTVKSLAMPQSHHGSVVVRVLAASILSYHREIYDGIRHYPFPTPIVPGGSAIGRVVSVGPDATRLEIGQLVFVDSVIRGRDDPSALFLSAIHEGSSAGSRKLMREVWHDGAFAEYARAPLENCIPLDEARLCSSLGYSIQDLMYLCDSLVPFGGLRDIQVEPGETVVVSPATGGFGGKAVQVAVAMGARVIAMGRNKLELTRLKAHAEKAVPGACVEVVVISGDEVADTASLQAFGTIDAILDLSPPAAANSTHLKSALAALRYQGRVSLMGFAEFMSSDKIRWKVIGDNIVFKGKLMYTRDDMVQFTKMMERGLFPKGLALADTKVFQLDDWQAAFDTAAQWTGLGTSSHDAKWVNERQFRRGREACPVRQVEDATTRTVNPDVYHVAISSMYLRLKTQSWNEKCNAGFEFRHRTLVCWSPRVVVPYATDHRGIRYPMFDSITANCIRQHDSSLIDPGGGDTHVTPPLSVYPTRVQQMALTSASDSVAVTMGRASSIC
nr:alcohol dehydrogenase [Quercus suber]